MIWLNPKTVDLGGTILDNVSSVSIDENSSRLVVEHQDDGPHVVFVDVPERKIVVKIRRRVVTDEVLGIDLGDSRALTMRTTDSGGDGLNGAQVTATVVVTDLAYDVDRKRGAELVITAIAVSSDGAIDPVTVQII